MFPFLSQELFPANKRSCEHFSKYFTDAGLKELSDFARNQQSIGARKELQKELQEQMSRGDNFKDVSLALTHSWSQRRQLASVDTVVLPPEYAHLINYQLIYIVS